MRKGVATPGKRRWRIIVGTSCVLAFAIGYASYRMRAGRVLRDVLPAFTEPPEGPRAPHARAFGFEVGVTSLPAARARLGQLGLTCPDTSMRGLMQKLREDKQRELEAVRARGGDVDSVSGASLVHRRSPKEANPQVRLSCEGVAAAALGRATDARGRLLLVFDSPAHPLRHVSFERSYPAAALAAATRDLDETRAASTAERGAPAGVNSARPLQWLTPLESKWRYADLEVRVSGIDWGPRGAVVSEIVEVPWPVRADAPARGALARR